MKFNLKHSVVAFLFSLLPHGAAAQTQTAVHAEKATVELVKNLKLNLGAGYGQTPVLYSKPTAFALGGAEFDVALSKNKRAYEKVQVIASKEGVNGRFDAGIKWHNQKGRKINAGVYASNDFNAKTFLIVDEPLNPEKNLAQKHSGLLQLGITAGLVQPIAKNVEAFVNGDIGMASYSESGECVYPFKSKTINHIDPSKSTYELNDCYNYEKAVHKSVASVNAGIKTKVKNLDLVCKGGYNTYNGANAAIGGVYHFNLFK